MDLAAPERPDAGDRAEQRALAGARRSGDQDHVAARDRHANAAEERLAVRERQSTRSRASRASAPGETRIPPTWLRTRSIASRKPTSRLTTARHSAISAYALTMKLSDCWTWPKASAVCTSPPSGISPRKKRGAATTNGKMIAAWL